MTNVNEIKEQFPVSPVTLQELMAALGDNFELVDPDSTYAAVDCTLPVGSLLAILRPRQQKVFLTIRHKTSWFRDSCAVPTQPASEPPPPDPPASNEPATA
jgi:hypothetical protein